jgi:hypothetical protein
MAAPAVAVVGALAAGPHAQDLAFATPAHPAATSLVSADRMMSADRMSSDQRGNVITGLVHFKTAGARSQHPTAPVAPTRHAPVASPSPAPTGRHRAPVATGRTHESLTCKGSGAAGAMLPENYATIVDFLTAHGYTGLAAAGIAGNIYQESGGNPESGGGLIGWTPLPGGYVTGNPVADLQTQLAGLLTFNDQFPADITALNAATSPVDAAYIYMNDFERPGFPAAANREAAAQAVAQACGL